MSEYFKLLAVDFVFVFVTTLIAYMLSSLIFDNVSLFGCFIGAVLARIFVMLAARRL